MHGLGPPPRARRDGARRAGFREEGTISACLENGFVLSSACRLARPPPARAGRTRSCWRGTPRPTGHPRTRGRTRAPARATENIFLGAQPFVPGTTPAHAGRNLPRTAGQLSMSGPPRTRGENWAGWRHRRAQPGTTPAHGENLSADTIRVAPWDPACTGRATTSCSSAPSKVDRPRMRGDTGRPASPSGKLGTTPRTGRMASGSARAGISRGHPAHAGEHLRVDLNGLAVGTAPG